MEDAKRKERQKEFKKLLIQLGGKMNSQDIKNVLFLYDDIEAGREPPILAVDVFQEMIQKKKIDSENPDTLVETLSNINRLDLADEVRRWCQAVETNNGIQETFCGETLDDCLLRNMAKEIGRDWKMLSRQLCLDETTIQSIHQAHFGDLHEAAYQALYRWKKDLGERATPNALKAALKEMKLLSIVHKFFRTP